MLRIPCAAAIPALILAAGTALASPPKIIDGEAMLSGEHTFSEVIVQQGGRLRVRPDAADPAAGWLHLKAARIVVEAGGMIDGSGAGYQGADGASGAQPDGTAGGGAFPGAMNRPGPGGGSAGAGHAGVNGTCSPFAAAPGQAYPSPLDLLAGSAGGAFHPLDGEPIAPSRGGHGGGRIVLEAAEIEIAGAVLARGGDGISVKALGSGGGAGGAIRIVTAALTGGGVVSARGGQGGTGTSYHGGGGGGGVVVIVTPDAGKGALSVEIEGGASGACTGSVGGAGIESLEALSGCPDVDADGHTAAICGGDDCDDGDPTIHPDAADDTCDGQDNDCSGAADDGLAATACPDLHTCQAGQCVPIGGGGGGPGPGPGAAAPDHLEVQGGCAAGPRGTRARTGLLLALLGLGLLNVRRRVVTRGELT